MTKAEALECMEKGYRIAHNLFSAGEWIAIDNNGYMICESGYIIEDEFWELRQGQVWETGWSIVHQQ